MMLFHLVKKEFLIVKKYVLLMLAISVLIPPFILWRLPKSKYAGPMGFILSAVFTIFIILQYVLLKEYQYPKAAALLCSTPYPRRLLVLSKYVFCLSVYAACCISFWIDSLIFPGLGGFHFELAIVTLFLLACFLGVYLPAQYKLGFEKTKFALAVIIIASPFILPQLLKTEGEFQLGFFSTLPPLFFYGIILLASLAVLAVSACLSVRFYLNTDQ